MVGDIFDFGNSNGIEADDSNFNIHRFDIIKYSIERNLSIAISNNNSISEVGTNFKLPKLKDTDWEKITDNISIISFLQGLSIGGKVYNGYAVVKNNKNEDVVTNDSIYIESTDNVFHRVTEDGLASASPKVGVFNIDLERRTSEYYKDGSEYTTTVYYYPKYGILSYKSIVTQTGISTDFINKGSIEKYLENEGNHFLATLFYTALGRERNALRREEISFE